MNEDTRNRHLQDSLEHERNGELLSGKPPHDLSADLAAYRTVFAALDETPGFSLPKDFADRMVVALTPEPFPWFERVLLPLAVTALTVATLVFAISAAIIQWADSFRGLPTEHLDLLGVVMLIAAGVWLKERFTRRTQSHHTVAS
ncbi:MAG: hypothetical protein KIS67_09295 [Verrucomicrobiae bacterium]|nr:hypothetical protein [Verrucomicrobiae bacterium]